MLALLQKDGQLTKSKEGLYYVTSAVEELNEQIRKWFENHDDFDPAGFKDISGGLSRKYLLALLECFDKERFTIRVGDKRQLRGKLAAHNVGTWQATMPYASHMDYAAACYCLILINTL